jgi:hypothetical protein
MTGIIVLYWEDENMLIGNHGNRHVATNAQSYNIHQMAAVWNLFNNDEWYKDNSTVYCLMPFILTENVKLLPWQPSTISNFQLPWEHI